MRTTLPAVSEIFMIFALILLDPTANAKPLPSHARQPSHALSAKPVKDYKILLSLGSGWNTSYTGLPKVTVTFINFSAHRLEFSLSSPFSTFVVEYKPTEEKATASTIWKALKPNSQTPPDGHALGKPAPSQIFSVLSEVPPKSQGKTEFDLPGLPMTANGLYRITAATNITEVTELDGPTNAPKVVRTFALNLRSNSIIIRRTARGFVTLNPSRSQKAAL